MPYKKKPKHTKPRAQMDPEKYSVPEDLQCGRELSDGTKCRAPRKYGKDGCRYHHSNQPIAVKQRKGAPRIDDQQILRFGVLPEDISTLEEVKIIHIKLANALSTGGLTEKKAAILQKSIEALERSIERIIKHSPEAHQKTLETIKAIAEAADRMPILDARRMLIDRNFARLEDFAPKVEVIENDVTNIEEVESDPIDDDGGLEESELFAGDEGEDPESE